MSLPQAGVVTEWSVDQIGRVRLSDGEIWRIGAAACVGFMPALGMEVWVHAGAPHPLGGTKATEVHRTSDPHAEARAKEEAARLTREASERRRLRLNPKRTLPSPSAALKANGLGWAWAQRQAFAKAKKARTAALERLRFKKEPAFQGFELAADEWSASVGDPCFLPLGGSDGDELGLYLHPSLGETAPVVYFSHEQEPTFTFLAPGVETLLEDGPKHAAPKAVATLLRAVDWAQKKSAERSLLRALMWLPPDAQAAAKALHDEYERLGWAFHALAVSRFF